MSVLMGQVFPIFSFAARKRTGVVGASGCSQLSSDPRFWCAWLSFLPNFAWRADRVYRSSYPRGL